MHIEVTKKRFGKWYLRLVAANGEILMVSETYHSKGNAMRAAGKLRQHLIGVK